MPISPYLQRLRQHVGHDLLLVPSVSVLVHDREGHLLLQKRADTGWWNLPGGAMDPGENLTQAAIRELAEETGLTVEPFRLVGIYSDPAYSLTYPNGDRVQGITALMEARWVSGELRITGDETASLLFFAPDALPQNLPARQRIFLADALAGRPEAFIR